MNRPSKFLSALSLFLLLGNTPSSAQFSTETGFFPIKNFMPEDYNNAMPKNSAIVQDLRGIMYFANDEGVLEYDGIRWKLYPVSNEESVHSLAVDSNGRIYVGAVNEFGYLKPDEKGELHYSSLLNELTDSTLGSFTIWYIHCIDQNVFFQSNTHLFRWSNGSMTVWKGMHKFHTSFVVNNTILIKQSNEGFLCLSNDTLMDVRGDEEFLNKSVFSVLPIGNNDFFAVTDRHGFYRISFFPDLSSMKTSQLFPAILPLIQHLTIINAIQIGADTYSMGTWGAGLLIYRDGKIVQLITKKSGLGDEVINNQFLDKDGNLWLALSDGITKIEINSPLSTFTEELGVDGSIEAIERFRGNLYLATERGLLLLLANEWAERSKIYDQNRFRKVKTFAGGLWDLLTFQENGKSSLLIASDNAILEMDENHGLNTVYECAPWRIYQSKFNPSKLYIGLDNGLALLVRKNNNWNVEYEFPEITERIFSIVEDNAGNLWLGTKGQGVIKIAHEGLQTFSNLTVTRFGSAKGFPENTDAYLVTYRGKILVGSKGLFEVQEETDSIVTAKNFPEALINQNRIITRLKADKNNKLWITTFLQDKRSIEAGFVEPVGEHFNWISTPFKTLSRGDLFSIHADTGNILWLGGSEGLYRFDPAVDKNYQKDFAALIRLNIIGSDSTIFFGSYFDDNGFVTTIQPDVLKPELRYAHNSLQFDFSAQNTEIAHPVEFSYFLEGYDRGWSVWSTESKRYYTNLNEGRYVFRVKARNVYNYESTEATYQFSILPPWYRTIWAYFAYVLLLVGFIFVIVKEYTKYLRAIIREKTKEIRLQKEIVEHKNEEITASIKYAQRIQEALLPPKEILVEAKIDHFILFKPRDIVSGDFYWFRQIGDYVVIAAADCTGHGVPGAFVSMLGMAFLNEISIELKELTANNILNALRALVVKSLRQTGKQGESKDGMDIALYVIDRKNQKLQFAGANNPLIIIRNQEIIQIKADRMPIGYYLVMDEFKNNEFDFQPNDMLYTFSDGYQDQFGGKDGSKFMIKKLKALMAEWAEKPTHEQKELFNNAIEEWKGGQSQIDDILLIGVRLLG